MRRLALAGVFAVLLVGVLLAGEFAARLWIVQHVPTRRAPNFYADATLLMKTDLAASTNYWIQIDSHRPGLNVDGGKRRTTGWTGHTVWVFGNSTLLAAELPDGETMQSYLQGLFSRTYGPLYRVENLASTGASVANQLERLKDTDLRPGDTVVFFDGVMDVESIYLAATRESADLPGCPWLIGHYGQMALVQVACHWASEPVLLHDEAWMRERVARETRGYRRWLLEAEAYSEDRGAMFHHFLQPHLWSRELRGAEQEADQIYRTVFLASWPAFERASPGVNLTHVLDDMPDRFYYDCCHTDNPAVNKRLAEIVFDWLTVY